MKIKQEEQSKLQIESKNENESNDGGESSLPQCSDLKKFEAGFWLMTLDCTISFSISFTLVAIGNEMLQARFKFSQEQASFYITLPYFIVAFIMPLLGYVSDKFGCR